MSTMTAPASSCFRCHKDGVVSEDQIRQNTNGNLAAAGSVNFYCPACLNTWYADRAAAELHGRFLDRAGLRAAVLTGIPDKPPAVLATPALSTRAVCDAIADEVQAKTTPAPGHLHAWRLKELAQVCLELQGELEQQRRRVLLQRWADLTLLIGTP